MARYYLKWKFGEDRFLQQCDLGFADEPIISYVSSQPTYFSTKKAAQAAKKVGAAVRGQSANFLRGTE